MATPATERPVISAQQYRVLQALVVTPAPQELFEFEVGQLKDKGFELSGTDIDRLAQLVPDEPQLFLIIPPRPATLDLDGLMAQVEVGGKRGKNYLNPQGITDLVETPASAHMLLDVEDGRKRLTTRSRVSREKIATEKRLAYPTWYGLVHCIIFPCVLEDHFLDLCGSRYQSGGMPSLSLHGEVPYLDLIWVNGAGPRWGAPSAGSVVGA